MVAHHADGRTAEAGEGAYEWTRPIVVKGPVAVVTPLEAKPNADGTVRLTAAGNDQTVGYYWLMFTWDTQGETYFHNPVRPYIGDYTTPVLAPGTYGFSVAIVNGVGSAPGAPGEAWSPGDPDLWRWVTVP